nr:uncharacterized protein LOC131757291 isoform X2 [Kogia breviceps]
MTNWIPGSSKGKVLHINRAIAMTMYPLAPCVFLTHSTQPWQPVALEDAGMDGGALLDSPSLAESQHTRIETGDQEEYHDFSELHEMKEDAAGPGHLSQKSLRPSHTTIRALGWDQAMTVYHTHDLVTLYHPRQRGMMTLQSQVRSKTSPKVTLLLRYINTVGRPVACMPSCALEEKDSSWHFPTLCRHGLMDGAWPAECMLDSAVSPSPGALCSHRWEHKVV